MRWLANYLRQVFCKHEWESEERLAENSYMLLGRTIEPKIHLHCKKCHWQRNFWKWSNCFTNTHFVG